MKLTIKVLLMSLIGLCLTTSYLYQKKPNKNKRIIVAVIDSGIDFDILLNNPYSSLCESGHVDFTGSGILDSMGHGTNVSGLIHKEADGANYCQVIIKALYEKGNSNRTRFTINRALKHVASLKPDIINMSYGGIGKNLIEYNTIKELLDNGTIIVAAAGNNGKYLTENCYENKDYCVNYYPALYDPRIIVVGNEHKRSNFGPNVSLIVNGVNKKGDYGESMSGTSQSTAIVTGRIIKRLNKEIGEHNE